MVNHMAMSSRSCRVPNAMKRYCCARLSLAAAVALSAANAVAQPLPAIDITLAPIPKAGEIAAVDVVQIFQGYVASSGEPAFSVPSRIATTSGQNYANGDISASDAEGPLPLALTNIASPAGHFLDLQVFAPLRATNGPITLKYRAAAAPAMSPRPRGPSYDLRGSNGGFGGAFFSFLLLPAQRQDKAHVTLTWSLDGLPAGAEGVTTSGPGNLAMDIPPSDLNTVFLLGGRISQHAPPREQVQGILDRSTSIRGDRTASMVRAGIRRPSVPFPGC